MRPRVGAGRWAGKTGPAAQRPRPRQTTGAKGRRVGAPAGLRQGVVQRAIRARSSSVRPVALFSGMTRCTTTCWWIWLGWFAPGLVGYQRTPFAPAPAVANDAALLLMAQHLGGADRRGHGGHGLGRQQPTIRPAAPPPPPAPQLLRLCGAGRRRCGWPRPAAIKARAAPPSCAGAARACRSG